MWFLYRSGTGEKYRIGYVKSTLNQKWELALDEVGLTVSESGWYSEMIEYSFVFDHSGGRYMFYNAYGKTRFGLVVLDDL